MLIREDVDSWCRARGYTLHMRSGDSSSLTYSKSFDKFHLSLTVDVPRKTMVLQGFPGMFTLSTGNISYGHKHFDTLFEARMIAMMSAIENNNLY